MELLSFTFIYFKPETILAPLRSIDTLIAEPVLVGLKIIVFYAVLCLMIEMILFYFNSTALMIAIWTTFNSKRQFII